MGRPERQNWRAAGSPVADVIDAHARNDENTFSSLLDETDEEKVDWRIAIAAVGGAVGVACIAMGYVFVLNEPAVNRTLASSPSLDSADLASTPEVASDQPSFGSIADSLPVATKSIDRQPSPKVPASQTIRFIDHRYNGVLADADLHEIKTSLRLSPDQEQKWQRLEIAFQDANTVHQVRADAGQRWTDAFREQVLSKLIVSASPLLQCLRADQLKGANRLSQVLGFSNVSAMVEAAKASTLPVVQKPGNEPKIAVTPVMPSVSKLPVLTDHRYDGLLTTAEIARIKNSLKLTPAQDAYWPPVAAILRTLGQQQMAQVDAGQKLDYAMSGAMAQQFYFAASPLLQTLTEDQKSEVRRRARMMGLEAYASYL